MGSTREEAARNVYLVCAEPEYADPADHRVAELNRVIRDIVREQGGKPSRLGQLLGGISTHLAEPHAFKYFAPYSWNFGVVLTYRQDWIPQTYQVGDLVASIPMTPGETRRYTTKQSVKTTRQRKEVERRSESTASEEQVTSRAQAEITKKATQSTSFEMSAESSFSWGFGSGSVSSGFKTERCARVLSDEEVLSRGSPQGIPRVQGGTNDRTGGGIFIQP